MAITLQWHFQKNYIHQQQICTIVDPNHSNAQLFMRFNFSSVYARVFVIRQFSWLWKKIKLHITPYLDLIEDFWRLFWTWSFFFIFLGLTAYFLIHFFLYLQIDEMCFVTIIAFSSFPSSKLALNFQIRNKLPISLDLMAEDDFNQLHTITIFLNQPQ